MCTPCLGQYHIEIELIYDLIEAPMKINTFAKVVRCNYPLIQGRHTIKKYLIFLKCFKYFTGMTTVKALLDEIKLPRFGFRTYTNGEKSSADISSLMADISGEMRREKIFQKEDLLQPAPDEE